MRQHATLLLAAVTPSLLCSSGQSVESRFFEILDTPYFGQHVGAVSADLNDDGAMDLLFAAGRHWIDQSFVQINLGPKYNEDGKFAGINFSQAIPIGPPGGYYQIDVASSQEGDLKNILLVGGTCHIERPNSFGACKKGENTPARLLHVNVDDCSVDDPGNECNLTWKLAWEHPHPKGDRNGGFAEFNGKLSFVLLGQGGVEVFHLEDQNHKPEEDHQVVTSSAYHLPAPEKTDERSDFARYAGFAAGNSPNLGGIIAAGRRSDYDEPQFDYEGNPHGINKLIYEEANQSTFDSIPLHPHSGEPYPGNMNYSIQSTNYFFVDVNGDGIEDLLEATFLYEDQRVDGYPLPQRVHFLDGDGKITDTLIVMETEHEDSGRSTTSGNIYSDSELPDVVFASAKGVVSVFSNQGNDEHGNFLGLEKRDEFTIDKDCQIRDVEVVKLASESGTSRVGIVCAVTCSDLDNPGQNHIFYIPKKDGGLKVLSEEAAVKVV